MADTVSNDDSSVSIERPALYIVATPIGNLGDLSARAIEVLSAADLILAEDRRVSAKLLKYYGINTQMRSLHDHNEGQIAERLVREISEGGLAVAQISDAGTPLISDPGYLIVNTAVRSGIKVHSIPGPCAAVAALSISGLPTDQFLFVGFLNAKQGAKKHEIERLNSETRTLIFYEAPHRIESTLKAFVDGFGADRKAVVARELTKRFETIYRGTLAELAACCFEDANMSKGEIVIVVEAATPENKIAHQEAERVLKLLLAELPASRAIKLAAEITGVPKNTLYDLAHKKP